MGYQDKYSEYLESIPAAIQTCCQTGNRIVLGYTSDLDAILTWDAARINDLLQHHMKGPLSCQEGDAIHSMEDFARILSFYAVHGLGGEAAITSADVVEGIKENFHLQYALGGTCAQGAAALGSMGIPAIFHITDRSQEVIDAVDYPGLESVKDGKKVPIRECVSGLAPLLHLIIQYSKGDTLQIHGKKYEIPVSNRLIADYDDVHKFLPLEADFLQYIEGIADQVYSYSVSGFNAIVDPDIAAERARTCREHYCRIQEKNPHAKFYFESAHYFSSRIRDEVYNQLAPVMDIMGMNEEELVHLTGKKAHPVDKDDPDSIISGLDYLLDLFPTKGIIMHSKDYALYYGAPMEDTDIEKGLTLGNLLSGTRARIGRYGTIADCRETLQLPLSPVGLAFAERLSHMQLKHHAVLVPSRYMEKPACTIGLGDTFVAGVQICFIR